MSKNFVCGIISLLLIGIFVGGCGGKYDDDILTVREGTMNRMPNVPIGKAFDQFFDKGNWQSFTSTENERIVEFNGESKIFDESVKITIQFSLNGDKFSLRHLGVDGEAMPDEAALTILDTILSSYKPGKK